MFLLLFILIIQYVAGETDLLSNETSLEIEKLNALEYDYDIEVIGHQAEFGFTIFNTNYAINELNIDSYYYSITFIDEQQHEERTALVDLPISHTEYHGRLKMKNLEHRNYLICVFFLKNNRTDLIGSSRFCSVVSISGQCRLETTEVILSHAPTFFLIILVIALLAIIILFSWIRDYVYRPRTIQAILKTLPEDHARDLENLADAVNQRRRRRINPDLQNRIYISSASTDEYDIYGDREYCHYHEYNNGSSDTPNESETKLQ